MAGKGIGKILGACLGGAALLFGLPAAAQDRGNLPDEAMVMRTDQMVGSHADPGGGSDTATKSGGGTGVLKVDGKVVAEQKMQRSFPFILQWDENLDIGADTGTPVDDRDYKVPFKFTGKLNKVTLTIDRPTLTPEDIKRLKAAQHAKAVRD